jgi:hypothetical protein
VWFGSRLVVVSLLRPHLVFLSCAARVVPCQKEVLNVEGGRDWRYYLCGFALGVVLGVWL